MTPAASHAGTPIMFELRMPLLASCLLITTLAIRVRPNALATPPTPPQKPRERGFGCEQPARGPTSDARPHHADLPRALEHRHDHRVHRVVATTNAIAPMGIDGAFWRLGAVGEAAREREENGMNPPNRLARRRGTWIADAG